MSRAALRPFGGPGEPPTLRGVWRAARSLWVEPAVTSPAPGGRRDQVLAAIVLVATAVEVVARPDLGWRPVAVGVGCALGAATLVRRTRCLAAEPVVLYTGGGTTPSRPGAHDRAGARRRPRSVRGFLRVSIARGAELRSRSNASGPSRSGVPGDRHRTFDPDPRWRRSGQPADQLIEGHGPGPSIGGGRDIRSEVPDAGGAR